MSNHCNGVYVEPGLASSKSSDPSAPGTTTSDVPPLNSMIVFTTLGQNHLLVPLCNNLILIPSSHQKQVIPFSEAREIIFFTYSFIDFEVPEVVLIPYSPIITGIFFEIKYLFIKLNTTSCLSAVFS